MYVHIYIYTYIHKQTHLCLNIQTFNKNTHPMYQYIIEVESIVLDQEEQCTVVSILAWPRVQAAVSVCVGYIDGRLEFVFITFM